MSNFNVNKYDNLNIHMLGIGGISMSALAIILSEMGHSISGSDISSSCLTEKLTQHNIKVAIGHRTENVKGCDLLCYTAAISKHNPELVYAKSNLIPCIERSELLGDIMQNYKHPIAIAGTHGKTTTTSMLGLIFLQTSLDPTILVGGELLNINGNYKIGSQDYLICEACEYAESFLKFYPFMSIITNIDEDHLDYFKDIQHITSSFKQFVAQNQKDGYVIFCADCQNTAQVLNSAHAKTISFGIQSHTSDFVATNIQLSDEGSSQFEVHHKGKRLLSLKLTLPGIYNIYNALAAITAAHTLNIPLKLIKSGIEKFRGTKRRFEFIYKSNDITIVDDYAHHPTEIRAALTAAKELNHRDIWCIFQPHTYTRTSALLSDFAESLKLSDHVIIPDIYPARETYTGDIHSCDLVQLIPNATYINDFSRIVDYLQVNFKKGDLIITVGAGDVYKIGLDLAKIYDTASKIC